MPRQARIDVPGTLYHVMSRGIERRAIFFEEADYLDFQERLYVWLRKCGAKCLAWCLMPNHFHLLLLRGERPLSEFMHHAMTGYAVNFNIRHGRVGHLFQNRYKAIICDIEQYLRELVPYIHLNPLRAELVKDLAGLAGYRWCGHGAVATGVPDGILDEGLLLEHFGGGDKSPRAAYMELMAEKAAEGKSTGALGTFRHDAEAVSDPRVLGDSDFVEAILRAADEKMNRPPKSRDELLVEAARITGVEAPDILRRTRNRRAARARAIYCHLCREERISLAELAEELGIGRSAVCRLAGKGAAATGGKCG